MEPVIKAVPVPVGAKRAERAGSQALQAIGLFKLAKAFLFFAAGVGMFHLVNHESSGGSQTH